MDEDLERLLQDPFEGTGAEAAPTDKSALLQAAQEHAGDITGRDLHDHTPFKQELDMVMRPHVSTVKALENRIFSDNAPIRIHEVLSPHEPKFKLYFDKITRAFKTYMETAGDEILEREAGRLERRYFEGTVTEEQRSFIKLKRYYEKARTFNEIASTNWRETQKLLDTFAVLADTRNFVIQIEDEFLKSINLLIRQTSSFLDALKNYLEVEEETLDQLTGSYRIFLTYDSKKNYTLAGFFRNDLPDEMSVEDSHYEEHEKISDGSDKDDIFRMSIARNIVLETREHRLNKASIFSATILGSRDWNRTPDYRLEVPVLYYDECMHNFQRAYQVNIKSDQIKSPLKAQAAVIRSGEGRNVIDKYVTLVHATINDIAEQLIEHDFPGLEKPDIFQYHCGPEVFYNCIVSEFKAQYIGEMFYLDETSNTIQEIPEEIIKKELIDWWNYRTEKLDHQDVDSYLTYSRSIEMVKKEYRALYDAGTRLRKQENPDASYYGLDVWLKENRMRIFGLRKYQVFRRFMKGTFSFFR